jgi:hypothetical protein
MAKADAQQLLINTAKGPLAVPWADIAPATVYEMGKAFVNPRSARSLRNNCLFSRSHPILGDSFARGLVHTYIKERNYRDIFFFFLKV